MNVVAMEASTEIGERELIVKKSRNGAHGCRKTAGDTGSSGSEGTEL